jgi:hypothetical protein
MIENFFDQAGMTASKNRRENGADRLRRPALGLIS